MRVALGMTTTRIVCCRWIVDHSALQQLCDCEEEKAACFEANISRLLIDSGEGQVGHPLFILRYRIWCLAMNTSDHLVHIHKMG